MKLKRIGLVAIAAGAVILSGCSAPTESNDRDDKLVLYSSESTMPEFAKRFEQEEGITVEVVEVSSGQSDARVSAEKDNPQSDVAISGSYPSDSHPELYRAFDGAVDVSNVDARYLHDDFGIPTIVNPVVFAYNNDVLDGRDAPTSWADLGDPKWKGEISIADPTQSGSAFNALAAVYASGGWDLVRKFAANVVIAQSSLGPIQALSNGEAAIGIGAENSVYQIADGTDIEAAYPKDGVVVNVGMFYLIADSSNQEAADTFMNWMLSSATQTWMQAEHKGMRSSTTDSTDPEGIPAMSSMNIIDVPDDVTGDKASFLDEWTSILTSVN